MSDDLTPQGAAAVRLAATVVQLTAERDRARDIAVALEQRLARVEALLNWGVGRDTKGVDRLIPASELRHALDADQ